ncbi:hypothetical protein BD289DRAFT_250245 [Coniella lustricola]|uniref:Uncharacterized protein n=1 Tax=Coniella lustricola TaxID=2025994 RepID=A0A2T3A8N8_9PEZI|nr:hypothetical protein BD289DRAFT_250245 [Coniella lustricola]
MRLHGISTFAKRLADTLHLLLLHHRVQYFVILSAWALHSAWSRRCLLYTNQHLHDMMRIMARPLIISLAGSEKDTEPC